jgi:endonuclease/exonuclease/phosphatase family metal-dependent hydrolase
VAPGPVKIKGDLIAPPAALWYLHPMGGKRSRWRRVLVVVSALLGLLLVTALGVLLLFEWRPEPLMETPVVGRGAPPAQPTAALSLLCWNIGYAGLSKDADFFMDGGEQVRPPDEAGVRRNLSAVVDFLEKNPADIVLLQEVDSDTSRSFGVDQVAAASRALPGHVYSRAINFKVPWIPYPLLRPIGAVESGLVSFSRYPVTRAVRHQLPGSYSWPVRVFHLKRCLHELRLPAPDGRDWVILHLHLSAFDRGGELRRQQMGYLKELMLRLHREGHHVVVGGDWNHAPPGVEAGTFPHRSGIPSWFQQVPGDWTPEGWQWAYDKATPSLRATNHPYVEGQNFVTIVDGFLVGPEIRIRSVRTTDLGFENTDHHPVRLEVGLTSADHGVR